LRDFRLVGRVAGEELAALHQRIDDDRTVMAIDAGAQEAGVADGVPQGNVAEVGDDFAFRVLAGHVEVAFEAVLGGDNGEQVVNRGSADFGEHLQAFVGRFGQVAHS
jgi:hypothetical protein